MKKILVAYFSASGNTRDVAKELVNLLSADLYEIKPAVPYTKADLNWMDKSSRSTLEMKDKNSRPEIIKNDIDVRGYDMVLVGFPIWWYTAPTIVNSFLEAYDFSNKIVVSWATSGGSGMSNSKKDLSKSVPNSNYIEGKVLNSKHTLQSFVEEIKKI